MSSIVLQSRSGRDGMLHLDVPVGQPDTEFEVEVVVRPRPGTRSLPPGYFDLLGSVTDETLVIHPQPPLPPGVEIE